MNLERQDNIFASKLEMLSSETGIFINQKQKEQLIKFACRLKYSLRKSFASWDDDEQGFSIHFKDSFLSLPEIKPQNLLDIGSGAGLPGVIYAVIFSDSNVTLLESQKKRCEFLQETITDLQLSSRVKVVPGRAEDLAHDFQYREKYELVTARAFAKFIPFIEYSVAFVSKNGYLQALRGDKDIQLIKKNYDVLKHFHLKERSRKCYQISGYDSKRWSILLKKEAETEDIYPRSNKKIKKGLFLK